MEYFELRAAQEDAAAKLKSKMKVIVQSMLYSDFGALQSGYHSAFFHEDEYNVRSRLERITKIKSFLGMYVDEEKIEKSAKNGGNNWGDVINTWIVLAESDPKDQAIVKFIHWMKDLDLLKDGMDAELKTAADLNDFTGEWTGVREYTVKRDNFSDVYKEQIRYEISVTVNGNLKIKQYIKELEQNGKKKNGEEYLWDTEIAEPGEYTLSGNTLTIVPKDGDFKGQYLYRFNLKNSKVMNCTEYLVINPYLYDWENDPTGSRALGEVTTELNKTK